MILIDIEEGHAYRFHTSNSSIPQDKGLQHMIVIIASSLAMF